MTIHRGVLAVPAALFLTAQAWGATHVVHVAPSGLNKFTDEDSNTSSDLSHLAVTTINPGETVQWKWEGDMHTVTRQTDPDMFDSGSKNQGDSFTRTFSNLGTFDYLCMFHFDIGMQGRVVVVDPNTPTTSSTVVGGTTTSTTLPPGVSAQFAAANLALATFAADLDATITNKSKKSFDKLLSKVTFDLNDAQSLEAAGQSKKAKTALRRVVRSLITMRQRLGSKTGRKAVTDASVRARLIAEAKDLKVKVQAALQSF